MDKRLHHFMDGFVLSCSSLHARISRFDIVGPPRLPPVFNVAVRFKVGDLFLFVLVLARRIVDSLSNIKSGGARGGSRIVFILCGSAACIFWWCNLLSINR